MSNQWTLKNQTASDDTHKAIYHGVTAKEIWYKGRKIWDNAPDFWSFAKPSSIGVVEPGWGDNPWRDKGLWVLYRSNHAEDYVEKRLFYPTNATLGIPLFDSEFGYDQKWAEWEQEDSRNHFYPPFITHGSGWFAVTSWAFDENVLTLAVTRTQDVAQREVYRGPFGWETMITTRYQTGYPFDCARFSGLSVPPGSYTISVDGVSSATWRTVQWVYDNSSANRYYAVTIDGVREAIDDSLSYIGGSRSKSTYSANLDAPADISLDAEIGGSRGDAGGSWQSTLKAMAQRSAPYISGLRPGQLRGIFSTEPRGKGTQYGYVVNDKRGVFAGKPGYYNVDPTECIDPETGVMVSVEFRNCTVAETINKKGLIAAYGFYVGREYSIIVSFYEKYVLIQKYPYESSRIVAEMKLYYYKGSTDYGHNWGYGG